jgi:hypothetical protein
MLKWIVLFLTALVIPACNSTTTPTPSFACTVGDQLPYVYHPDRLKVIQPCVRLLARIEAMRNEGDGDVHIFARLNDADAQQYLNPGNDREKGDLVVEPVCVHSPTQADAIQPCSQDPNPLTIAQLPKVGDCVWLEGQFVEDTAHFNWREIHPLARIQPGQGCPEARILTADDFFDPGD